MPPMIDNAALVAPGKGNEERVGYSRQCLRAVLSAASCPGAIVEVPDARPNSEKLSAAGFAVCCALLSMDSRLWLSSDLRRDASLVAWLRFQCGATGGAHSSNANLALLGAAEWDGLDRFRFGDAQSPRISTTVIVEVDSLHESGGIIVHDAECETDRPLDVRGLGLSFWHDVNRNYERAPCGLDFLLTWNDCMVAITRNCFVTLV